MKKLVALALTVSFGFVYGAAPVLAGGGPTASMETGAPATGAATAEGPGWTHVGGSEKNPLVPGMMSLLVPCTGQWYNGQLFTLKSAAMAAIEGGSIFVLAFFAAGGAGDDAKGVALAGMGGMIANHLWSGIDAWYIAKKDNQRMALQLDQNRALVSYNIPF